MNGCTDCLSPAGETANAAVLNTAEETLVGSTPTLGTNTTRCKVCLNQFEYTARRGRPPVLCQDCTADLDQKKQARESRKQARFNAQEASRGSDIDPRAPEPAWVKAMRESIRA